MKKRYPRNTFQLILMTIFFSQFLSGHTQNLSFSLAVGGNTSNLSFSEERSDPVDQDIISDSRQSYYFNAAVYANYKITSALFFRTGLRYTKIGSDIFVDIDPDIEVDPALPKITRYDIQQDYIYFPIKLAYQSEATWNFAFSGGIELGYLFSGEVVTNYDIGDPSTESITETMEKFNAALNGTVGYDFPFLGLGLMTELGISYGIINVAKEDEWPFNWKTMEYYLLIGFYF